MQAGSYWVNPEFRNWPGYRGGDAKKQDQAEAKKLLHDSGLDGVNVNITCRDFYQQNCEFAELSLRGLGANPKLDVMDQLKLQALTQAGNYQTQIAGLSPDLPNDMLLSYVSTNPSDTTFAKDPKIDEYNRLIATTIDQVERRKILWEAEYYLLIDKAYTQPWSREEGLLAFRDYVKGVWVPGTQTHNPNDHRNTWIDKSLKA